MLYLYIKTHNKTGLCYLGKTEREDYEKYKGSGVKWKNHLKVHGNDISTQVLLATEDITEFKETAKFFSRLFNVVKSSEWANLKEEEGDGGTTSTSLFKTQEHKNNISEGIKKTYWEKRDRNKQKEICRKAGLIGGKNMTKGKKNKISKSLKEYNKNIEVHPNKGLVREKIICPHCNKQGSANVIFRWHFNNCKFSDLKS